MKHIAVKLFIFSLVAMILLTGCGKGNGQPVAIQEDTDKCEICHMAVKDDQFASEIILDNGKSLVFDDVGCMYKWIKENGDGKIANSYVKDYQTKEWIDADKATFVYDKPIRTPMAYNVIAFTDKKDAESFIDDHGGNLLTHGNLEDHSWERNADMVKEMKEKMKNMDMNGEHNDMNRNEDKDNMDMNQSDDSESH